MSQWLRNKLGSRRNARTTLYIVLLGGGAVVLLSTFMKGSPLKAVISQA